jgi:DNA-binding transcriptional LysR family regulator
MELRQLRYFLAVAEELHFGRAAARLLIASPSLSQQIMALERDLHVRLFDRSSTGVRLTPAGEQLRSHAAATLAAADDLRATADRLAAGRSTRIRLGFLPFALVAPSRRLLAEFGRRHPDVDLEMRQYEWDDPSAGLLTGQTDAALVRTPFTGADRLQTAELGREPVLAVMADSHPLAAAPALTAQQVADQPFLETGIVRDPVFAAYWYLRELRDPVRSPAVRSRSSTVEEWLAEVALGRGVDLLPAGMAAEYRRPGLAFVPVEDLPRSRLVLAWDPTRAGDAVARLARLAASGPRARVRGTGAPG